jgi:hypothetical protein
MNTANIPALVLPVLVGVLLVAVRPSALADTPVPPANPLAPVEQKGQQVNGLAWTVRLAREFTVFDAAEAFTGVRLPLMQFGTRKGR